MKRLEGLDFARYLALVGMIIINFDAVMINPIVGHPGFLANVIQGKAAALFVMLAGLGYGLAMNNKTWKNVIELTCKRAVILCIFGLINCLVFEADIIHNYAFYFLFCLFFLPLSNKVIIFSTIALIACSQLMIMVWDYDSNWDWQNLSYNNFWTWAGFFKNLFFNGWNPVMPWITFMLVGIILSRMPLKNSHQQLKILLIGLSLFLLSTLISSNVLSLLGPESDIVFLFHTKPIPPNFIFVTAAIGSSMAMIGLCLLLENFLGKMRLLQMCTPAGKQTLTWYIVHIFAGMGYLELSNRIANQTPKQALLASVIFCCVMTLVAYIIRKKFRRGPFESLMKYFMK